MTAPELVWQSHELKRTGGFTRLPPGIAGGSDGPDASLVMSTITNIALCLDCIAQKTGLVAAEADAVLTVIGTTLRIVRGSRCSECRQPRPSFTFITRPSNGGAATNGPKRTNIIRQFLERRRGEVFCAECVAATLFAGKPVDNSLRQLEGLGARRYHGVCSQCGRPRLVSGLER